MVHRSNQCSLSATLTTTSFSMMRPDSLSNPGENSYVV
jgi:hypothetical protein